MSELTIAAPELPDDLNVRQRKWIKRVLPKTMFGRSLLLIVIPLILVQVISAWVFYARHWETVAHRFASDVASEIIMLADSIKLAQSDEQIDRLMNSAQSRTELTFSFERDAELPAAVPVGSTRSEEHLRLAMFERASSRFRVDGVSDPGNLSVLVQLPDGVLHATMPYKRLNTSTTYIFILWMIGSSLVLFAVAAVFLRNQLKSLRLLAAAA